MAELAERLRRLRVEAGGVSAPGPARRAPGVVGAPPPLPAEPVADGASAATPADGLKALLRRHAIGASRSAGRASSAESCAPDAGSAASGSAADSGAGTDDADPMVPASYRSASAGARSGTDGLSTTSRTAPTASPLAGAEISPGLFEHRECLPIAPPVPWLWLPDLHPRLLPTDALLHFDSETTGLAGGTGTRAFMLGFARWRPEGLEVRQLWISRLAAEPLMLERFAQWLAEGAFQLVSYNGRSFDAPLLRARYRLCRQRDPLHGLPHHDLLHAVRRRFRSAWPSCRLGEAEARLLGVRRVDDLPGAEVPAAFLASLRHRSAAPLQRVRLHHFQDLLSLAGLLPRLCELSARAPERWALQACERAQPSAVGTSKRIETTGATAGPAQIALENRTACAGLQR